MRILLRALLSFFIAFALLRSGRAQTAIPLIDIKSVDPSIVVELRYSTSDNIAGRPLYPPETEALVRPETAQRLSVAQRFLRERGYSLKIWDAHRPRSVQEQLWQVARKSEYVADPDAGAGSLHRWGIAVDATLVDSQNQPVRMPTDFDNFTPAAMWRYRGSDRSIRAHLGLLQTAMARAGFLGLRAEWWHFTVIDWQKHLPPEEVRRAKESFGPRWRGKL